MVFQSYALYPNMTVAGNIAFGMEMRGVSKSERDAAITRVSEVLQIGHLLNRRPSQLSGGQRQRVAMGRALVRNPQVFLFDEPLSNLDAKLRVQMRTEIKTLHQRLGTTMVYVTHDQMEAMTMADRIVVMRAGHIEQIGSPLEIYDAPANSFVAGFIGSPSMNFIDGLVIERDGTVELRATENLHWPLPESARRHLGRSVQLGIRPEHVAVDAVGVQAKVIIIEPTGSDTHLQLQAGAQSIVAAVRDRPSVSPGQPIQLKIDPAKAHLFDPSNGKRLH
jgi:multiple sugar transport system ATP-binding protein